VLTLMVSVAIKEIFCVDFSGIFFRSLSRVPPGSYQGLCFLIYLLMVYNVKIHSKFLIFLDDLNIFVLLRHSLVILSYSQILIPC
jgi:hypothetical protein